MKKETKVIPATTCLAYMLMQKQVITNPEISKIRQKASKLGVFLDTAHDSKGGAVLMNPHLFKYNNQNEIERANGSENLYRDDYLDACYLSDLPKYCKDELKEILTGDLT